MRDGGRFFRRGAGAVGILLLAGLGYAGWVLGEAAAGYTAKVLCSCVFVSERDPGWCLREDLGAYGWVPTSVDRKSRTTTATAFFVRRARAEFRERLGCALR